MKKTTLIILLTITTLSGFAQEKQLFDGGMMLHAGYLNGNIKALDYNTKGMTYGIGGMLRFHIGNHLRVGGEGYVSNLSQMGNGSYVRMGLYPPACAYTSALSLHIERMTT